LICYRIDDAKMKLSRSHSRASYGYIRLFPFAIGYINLTY